MTNVSGAALSPPSFFEAELYFYSQIFGFTPAHKIEPIEIYNLPTKK